MPSGHAPHSHAPTPHAGHRHTVWSRLRHGLVPHGHDHSEAIRTADEASAVGIRAAWISLAGMGVTAAVQIVIVGLSGSVGLLADTLHNLGHLATTIPLVIAFRLGRKAPTRRYTYGFRRAEDLVGLLIGAVIALSAVLIVWESVQALTRGRELTHLGWVLAAAFVGATGNEIVARYRIRAGRRIGSAALVAEGHHARTDALTSLAVVLGVLGAWVGQAWVDPVVGLVIAAVIISVLIGSMRTVLRRLMDGADPATVDLIEATCAEIPGVISVTGVRARWTGHRLEADLEIDLEPALTIQAGDGIATDVLDRLRDRIPHLEHACIRTRPSGSSQHETAELRSR